MVRRTLFITGSLLIAVGLAFVPLLGRQLRPQDHKPVDAQVDVFSDKTQTAFVTNVSGYYDVSFVVERTKPYNEVYCMLRGPEDYWSAVTCDKGGQFKAGWTLFENDRVVQTRNTGRSATSISGFRDENRWYMKRYLGTLYAERGHYYNLNLELSSVDTALRDLSPRLQITLDPTEVELRGWLTLWAMIAAPLCILGGIVLFIKGFLRKPNRD